MAGKIAFQGERGANSEIACKQAFPHLQAVPYATFEDAFNAVESGEADLGMIPVENTIAGRVADIHHLLPDSNLHIIAEHFLPIRFQLMALPGAKLSDIKRAKSHVMGLGQCRIFLRQHGIEAITAADTAGAARQVAEDGEPTTAAIAPALAAEVYGLNIIARDIEDEDHNTTRFVVMSSTPNDLTEVRSPCKTALMFTVRNVPAALYKGLGGFATNGVNVTKLESYLTGGSFTAAQFYVEFEGHPDERPVQLALEELGFFSTHINVLGVFPKGSRP